jgi:FkbM family methyltransferase
MSKQTPAALAELVLPDGDAIVCLSEAEALVLWSEINEGDAYTQAAQHLRRGDVVLDVGANIGLTSLMLHRRVPSLTIYAFEPAPATWECLHQNLHRHVPGAIAVNAAVCAQRGRRTFTFYPNSPGNSSLLADPEADDATTRIYLHNTGIGDEFIDEIIDGLHNGLEIVVDTTTISELIREHDIGDIGLLKIDVERAELEVLKGIETQHWPLIRHITAEVHAGGGRLTAITDLLASHGFTVTISQAASLTGTDLYDLQAHPAHDGAESTPDDDQEHGRSPSST